MFPDRLLAGYRAFLDERLPRERARFEALAERGQSPEIMVIGCCDLRVSPEVIFDASPGELFVVRNVANLVPPYETQGQYHGTSAALEFAVQALRVKHIVVLGHARWVALEHDDGSGLAVVAGPSAEAGADPCRIGERALGWGLRCRSVLPSRLLHKASMKGRSSGPKASVTGLRRL